MSSHGFGDSRSFTASALRLPALLGVFCEGFPGGVELGQFGAEGLGFGLECPAAIGIFVDGGVGELPVQLRQFRLAVHDRFFEFLE